jgi:hypothetical protein
MSSDSQIVLALAVVGWIFSGGVFYAWTKSSIGELRRELAKARGDLYRDINGIGTKVRADQNAAKRHHSNNNNVLIFIAPKDKQVAVMGMLREDS